MSIPERHNKLIGLLTDATRLRAVGWREGTDGSVFASLSDSSIRVIPRETLNTTAALLRQVFSGQFPPSEFVVQLLDQKGAEIDGFSVEKTENVDFERMELLYREAKWIARGADKKIEEIERQLQEIIEKAKD